MNCRSRIRLSSILISALCILAAIALPTRGEAQHRQNAHGFSMTYPGALAVGVFGGGTATFGSAGPTGACDCVFDGGSGMAYTTGLALDIFMNPAFALRVQGLYEVHAATYTLDKTANLFASDGSPVSAVAERRATTENNYFATSLQVVWFTGLSNLYLSAGAGASFHSGGTVKDEETLKTPGVFYGLGSNHVVFHDGDLDKIATPATRASLMLGLGFDISIARGFALAPEAQFDIPLTSVTEEDADWKTMVLRFGVVARFGI